MKFLKTLAVFLTFLMSAQVVVAQNNIPQARCDFANPYHPKYFGLKGRNPVNGTTRVAVPLESDACIYMLTTAGKRWVAELKGTVLRHYVNEDGTLGQPYALDECGNPIDAIAYHNPLAPNVDIAQNPPSAVPTPIIINNIMPPATNNNNNNNIVEPSQGGYANQQYQSGWGAPVADFSLFRLDIGGGGGYYGGGDRYIDNSFCTYNSCNDYAGDNYTYHGGGQRHRPPSAGTGGSRPPNQGRNNNGGTGGSRPPYAGNNNGGTGGSRPPYAGGGQYPNPGPRMPQLPQAQPPPQSFRAAQSFRPSGSQQFRGARGHR